MGDNINKIKMPKEPKPDYRRRTTHQPNGLPKNERVIIPVYGYGIGLHKSGYDDTFVEFLSLMEELEQFDVFSKISIPLFTKAKYITGDQGTKWNTIIGYIKRFDDYRCEATCVIYNRSIKIFHNLEDPVIIPRVQMKDGKCKCIIAFDVVERKDFKIG